MTPQARELIEKFEVRKTKAQKAAFREWLSREHPKVSQTGTMK